ncbi:MAG: ParB N-terminal domain-containing protein [Nocardioidaceae bacterium]
MKLDSIRVGKRHRYDLGDIAGLAQSMQDLGQLQPIAVTPDGSLVAGERRIAAARSLGWTQVKVHVVADLHDAAALLRAERDENTCRKALLPTEEHALYVALLAIEQPKAKERQGRPGQPRPGKFPNRDRPARLRPRQPAGYMTLPSLRPASAEPSAFRSRSRPSRPPPRGSWSVVDTCPQQRQGVSPLSSGRLLSAHGRR